MNQNATNHSATVLTMPSAHALDAQVRMATRVCKMAAEGDLEPRILGIEGDGPLDELFLAINHLLDLTDAFVREAGASLDYASHDRFFRRVLPRGLHGSFRTGAAKINAATVRMGEKAREISEMKAERLMMADEFESVVKSLVDSLASSARQVRGSAETLTESASATTRRSGETRDASEHASLSVQAVAAAAEEMGASIDEITRQVVHSTKVAQQASEQATRTTETVAQLAEVTGTIDGIVKAINTVASQTKLLALNAAIEAARAGEAGKGFAVVAQEVKSLAGQTSHATEEIGSQISAIHAVIGRTREAIQGVGVTVGEINDIAGVISAAVTEQGAATQEIARNAERAAEGTRQVSEHVGGIAENARDNAASAGQLLAAAATLAGQSDSLRSEVDRFLAKIREDRK